MVTEVSADRKNNSPWQKLYHVSRKQIVAFIFIVIILVSLFGWVLDRYDSRKNWGLMVDMAQDFGVAMYHASYYFPMIVQDPHFTNDTGLSDWSQLQTDLDNAGCYLFALAWYIDVAHSEQLMTIRLFLFEVEGFNAGALNARAR